MFFFLLKIRHFPLGMVFQLWLMTWNSGLGAFPKFRGTEESHGLRVGGGGRKIFVGDFKCIKNGKSRFHLEKCFCQLIALFQAKKTVWLFVNAPSRKQDALFSLLLGIANYEDLFDEGRKVIMTVHHFRSRTYLCSCFYASKKLKASQFLKKEDALASRIFSVKRVAFGSSKRLWWA